MTREAMLATNTTIGISVAKSLRIDIPRFFACILASMNLLYSSAWEFKTRTNAAPMMLSLMTLLSQSITSLLFLNNTLTWRKTMKKAPLIIGMMAKTDNASLQSVSYTHLRA